MTDHMIFLHLVYPMAVSTKPSLQDVVKALDTLTNEGGYYL